MKKNKKILLVEDEEEMSFILKIILENNGYNVSLSSDGKNIFPFYTDQNYKGRTRSDADLILLDKQLQGKNGLEICKQIKSDPYTKDIPIIIISAAPISKEELQYCRADNFVEKPFDISNLLQLVAIHLNQD